MPQTWAIVGTGTISRSVVSDLLTCPGVEVALVQSRDPAKARAFAEEFSIPRSTGSYEDVLSDETIDVLYIATPFATHHALGAQALRAGKHVLLEKPMAMDTAQVRELFAIAEEHGVFLMEAMWMKFSPLFQRLQSELEAGRIGAVRNLRASFSMPFPEDGGSRWRPDGSPGSLLDQGIYPVTLAHSMFGVPTSVHAGGSVRDNGVDVAEHFTLEFDDGRFAQGASGMTAFSDLSAAVGGTQGWITVASPFWASEELEIHADDMVTIFRTPRRVRIERIGNGYVPMLTEVARAIEGGLMEHPVHPAKDTIEVFTILDNIRNRIIAAVPRLTGSPTSAAASGTT